MELINVYTLKWNQHFVGYFIYARFIHSSFNKVYQQGFAECFEIKNLTDVDGELSYNNEYFNWTHWYFIPTWDIIAIALTWPPVFAQNFQYISCNLKNQYLINSSKFLNKNRFEIPAQQRRNALVIILLQGWSDIKMPDGSAALCKN